MISRWVEWQAYYFVIIYTGTKNLKEKMERDFYLGSKNATIIGTNSSVINGHTHTFYVINYGEMHFPSITIHVTFVCFFSRNFMSYQVLSHSEPDPSSTRNQCGWKIGQN